MKVDFYGARGSIPTPLLPDDYHKKIKELLTLFKDSNEKDVEKFLQTVPSDLSRTYGGNTSCVAINDEGEELIVMDAGSGLRMLGNKLAEKNNLTVHVFLSHFHWDHICGIPFFKPIYNPTNKIIFYSPSDELIRSLSRQQHASHFPVPFKKLPAKKKFVILNENQATNLNGFEILNVPLNHPNGSYGYVFTKNDKKISYVTDVEFTPENLKEKSMFYKACFESSSLLIMDCQYSLMEFFSKFDWGHTSSNIAVNLALEWRVKKLVLFHYDPTHSDSDLIRILDEANKYKTQFNRRKLDIFQAIEGESIEV